MQKIKDILRLKFDAKLSLRQIALSLSLSLGVISKYLQRAEAAGLGWPLPDGMSDSELAKALISPSAIPAQGLNIWTSLSGVSGLLAPQ